MNLMKFFIEIRKPGENLPQALKNSRSAMADQKKYRFRPGLARAARLYYALRELTPEAREILDRI